MKSIRDIRPSTSVCALIGNPVGHSLSPAIHNAAFDELGLDFVYVAFRVADPAAALAGMRAMENFRGMSVTIPHKLEVMKYLDDVAPVDRRIGSINTIIRDRGRLMGFGTDGPGAIRALTDAGVAVDGKTVLFLGAGGVARAIAFALAISAAPSAIRLLDIDKAVVDTLSADLSAGTSVPVHAGVMTEGALADAMALSEIIIHCTRVGMSPKSEASLVPKALFRPGQAVFDAVYNPLETRLLAEARDSGCRTISGVEMFIHQAALQFEAFTGNTAPVEVMRRVVMENLSP